MSSTRTGRSACVLCSQVCGIVATVDGRHILSVRGDDADPVSVGYICNKARRLDHYQSSPERLTSPLRRQPDGTFEPIDWDTALGEIATRLGAIVAANGGTCLGFHGGGGQANHLGGPYGQALLAAMGSDRYFNATAQENTGEYWVNGRLFGSQQCHTTEDVANAEVVVLVGTNPWSSHTFPQARRRLNELAADPDRCLVVIDPVRTETADRADHHLRPRPGTDAHLLAAMLALLVRRGGIDREFLAERTTGQEALEAVLAGIDVDRHLSCAGVPVGQVEAVVDRIALAASVTVRDYMGVRHNRHSALNTYLTKLIAILTGNMGKLGGLNLHSWFYPLMQNTPDGPDARRSPVTGQIAIGGIYPPNRLPEEILTDHPQRIRAMVVDSSDPAHTSAGAAAQRAAFEALDLLVVVDVAMSETARLAHYVLPAASQFEKWETVVFTPHFPDNVFKVRPPLFDLPEGLRTEQQIYTELLRRLGKLPPESELAKLRALAARARSEFIGGLFDLVGEHPEYFAAAPAILADTLGPSLGDDPRLAATSVLWFLCHQLAGTEPVALGRAGFDGDPATAAEALFDRLLTTPEGVVFTRHEVHEMWSWIAHPDRRIHVAIDELLTELAQLPEAPAPDAELPLVLAAGQRRRWNANTIIKTADWRDDDRLGALTMHPDDLGRLGLHGGQTVTVQSRAGAIRTTVSVSDRELPGHCTLPHGFGFGSDAALTPSANELTDPADRCPIAATPHHKFVPVRVEAAD